MKPTNAGLAWQRQATDLRELKGDPRLPSPAQHMSWPAAAQHQVDQFGRVQIHCTYRTTDSQSHTLPVHAGTHRVGPQICLGLLLLSRVQVTGTQHSTYRIHSVKACNLQHPLYSSALSKSYTNSLCWAFPTWEPRVSGILDGVPGSPRVHMGIRMLPVNQQEKDDCGPATQWASNNW